MKMLVAYDGSNSALNALKTAVSYAKVFHATICLVASLYGEKEDSKEKIEQVEEQLIVTLRWLLEHLYSEEHALFLQIH